MTNILVIEDEHALREEITTILRYEDYDVSEARDGLEGVEVADKFMPDLVICDIRMPGLDGYGVLERLQSTPRHASIPFIFLTAKTDKLDRRRGMALGADDYLSKPVTHDELLTAVRARLTKRVTIQREAQQDMEHLRQNLVNALPHELRTPLHGIVGYAGILKNYAASTPPEEIEEMANYIYQYGGQLHHLIEHFWLYAQLEIWQSDPAKIEMLRADEVCHVADIVDEVAHNLAATNQRTNDLQLDLGDACLAISDDYFGKVIHELIENALKFSKSGQPVTVSSQVNGRMFEIRIRDCGRGMSPEQLRKIGAYVQFERATYEQQGLGLGLHIARRIVEIHAGQFMIDSTVDSGTQVVVKLPLVKA